MQFAQVTAKSIHLDFPWYVSDADGLELAGRMVAYIDAHWPMSAIIHRTVTCGMDFTELDISEALACV